ncbi:MAG: cadherin-like beta sandwich domain-containing protein [Clostridia bacterium]|nr:cadherin-like beta sandwich domain-containing protein [Clostridia bacterium]
MNFRKILALTVSVIVLLSCMVFNVSAATATISFSNGAPKVGEAVTVTLTVQGTEAMYGTDFNVSYNPNVLRFDGGDSANGGAGNIKVASGVSGSTKQTYTLKFTAIAAGSSPVSASGGAFYEVNDDTISGSATINVSDVTKSDNANLSALRVSAGTISPRFSQNVTEYTINVKKSITECKVYGTTADPNATISITGSATLKIGENKRVLTVTAPSGAQKSYTLTIIRSSEDDPEENSSSEATVPSTLETVIDGNSYVVLSDIADVTIPKGFSPTKRLYNNEEISVATDEKGVYELFYLKQSGSNEAYPYTYDEDKNAFTRVLIINQLGNSYIVAEITDDFIIPNGYTKKSFKIDDMKLDGYISDNADFEDMYYIYCYVGGDFATYRYDAVEKVLQRSPEFKLVQKDSTEQTGSKIEIFNRFAMLSTNAKTIVVCLCVAFLGMIALLVLIIIKLVKRNTFEDYDADEDFDDFDTVTFDDDFKIETDEDNTEE